MKIIKNIVTTIVLWGTAVTAQIGTNSNTPNNAAILDLNNGAGTSTKGLLLPKVTLTSTSSFAPLAAHTAGMHVYNTEPAGTGTTAVTPGEYYNNGSKWLKVQTNAWELSTNTKTDPSVNFLGTTDNTSFTIITNNKAALYVYSWKGIVFGYTPPYVSANQIVMTTKPLQIKDGTQGEGKILTSDANGVGRWADRIDRADGSKTYNATTAQTFANNVSTEILTSEPIIITRAGTYMVNLRWSGKSDGPNATGYTAGRFELYKNGTKVDEAESLLYLKAASNIFSVHTNLLSGLCQENDVLTIKVKPTDGVTSCKWYTGTAGTTAVKMPAIVLMKVR